MNTRIRRQLAIKCTQNFPNIIEHWEKDLIQNCNEFVKGNSCHLFSFKKNAGFTCTLQFFSSEIKILFPYTLKFTYKTKLIDIF